jgi:hypothetical protein
MFLLVSRFIFIFILYYILGCLLSHTHHMCRVVLCCVVLCDWTWNLTHTYSMILSLLIPLCGGHGPSSLTSIQICLPSSLALVLNIMHFIFVIINTQRGYGTFMMNLVFMLYYFPSKIL